MILRTLLPAALIISLSLRLMAAPPDSSPKLPGIDDKMLDAIKSNETSGAVTLVLTRDKIVHLSAVGQADSAKNLPMKEDSIFWIASMTKPITATAIMMMQEEGKLNVDDPIGKYIPELAEMKTADGKAFAITLRQMLSHTSGMPDVGGAETAGAKTLADLVPAIARKPLNFAPSSKWSYCQSGINMAGRIVEIVSGQSLPEFFNKRITGPLGMKDTTFYLSEAQLPRLALSYKKNKEGKLEETPNFFLGGKSPTDRDRVPMANGGLFSTASDYGRFLQMALSGGTLDGHAYLKPESIKAMTTITTGDLQTGFTPGNGWGIGWCIVKQPQGVTASLSPGSAGHGGAYGTQAWMDPAKGRAYILMIQRSGINADGSSMRQNFQDAAAAAMDKK